MKHPYGIDLSRLPAGPGGRRRFPPAVQVAILAAAQKHTVAEVCRALKISQSAVRRWKAIVAASRSGVRRRAAPATNGAAEPPSATVGEVTFDAPTLAIAARTLARFADAGIEGAVRVTIAVR